MKGKSSCICPFQRLCGLMLLVVVVTGAVCNPGLCRIVLHKIYADLSLDMPPTPSSVIVLAALTL